MNFVNNNDEREALLTRTSVLMHSSEGPFSMMMSENCSPGMDRRF